MFIKFIYLFYGNSKIFQDEHYNNKDYVKICDITDDELLYMEILFIELII
jgi:hypothetical protein